jgi:hypothetical protein
MIGHARRETTRRNIAEAFAIVSRTPAGNCRTCGVSAAVQHLVGADCAKAAELMRIAFADLDDERGLGGLPSRAVSEVEAELVQALAQHGRMHGPHEGYAVILEELDELWKEVKRRRPRNARLRAEAMQVAAMGLRFMIEVTRPEDGVLSAEAIDREGGRQ